MSFAKIIDHTILHSDCSDADIARICKEAMKFGFAAVCVPPYHVKRAKKLLKDTSIKVATVIGFPMGYSTIPAKVEEIKRAVNDGVDEVDVVINIAAVKSKDWNYVKNDIESTVRIAQLKDKVVKLILETGLLTEEEIIALCAICKQTEPDFVKTSTGFHGDGASPEMITLLRDHLPKKIKIKASGGIRTYEDAKKMVDAGANRLGCSASIRILQEQPQ